MKFFVTLVLLVGSIIAGFAHPALSRSEYHYLIAKATNPDMQDEQSVLYYTKLAHKAIGIKRYKCQNSISDPQLFELCKTLNATLFVIEGGKRYKISDCKNPALNRLRHLGLPEPKGYVFLRKVPSFKVVPPELRVENSSFFSRVAGITCQCRLILLIGKGEDFMTLSHELVHAYTLSVSKSNFPTWFLEGLSTYYSDQHFCPRIRATGNWFSSMTSEYHMYLTYMWYLEHTGGKSKLNRFVRDSLRAGSIEATLPAYYGIDETELKNKVSKWNLARSVFRWLLVICVFVLLKCCSYIRKMIVLSGDYEAMEAADRLKVATVFFLLLGGIALILGAPNSFFLS